MCVTAGKRFGGILSGSEVGQGWDQSWDLRLCRVSKQIPVFGGRSFVHDVGRSVGEVF